MSGFIEDCNRILVAENSGCRFIDKTISPITNEQELLEIKNALNSSDVVRSHLERVLDLFSNRTNPDYQNSMKESISTVEAICSKIAKSNATLGQTLDTIERKKIIEIAPPLRQAFDSR